MVDEELLTQELWENHGKLFAAVDSCADRVVAEWAGELVEDRQAIVEPLEAALERHGVWRRLPAVLETAVTVLDLELVASPVPAPPYVVVSSRGPVLRGTTTASRVVMTLTVFELLDTGDEYRRTDGLTVDVELRERGRDAD